MKATRAEIEMIAIALYESNARYEAPKTAWPWLGLTEENRKGWRTRAQRLLTEEKL